MKDMAYNGKSLHYKAIGSYVMLSVLSLFANNIIYSIIKNKNKFCMVIIIITCVAVLPNGRRETSKDIFQLSSVYEERCSGHPQVMRTARAYGRNVRSYIVCKFPSS